MFRFLKRKSSTRTSGKKGEAKPRSATVSDGTGEHGDKKTADVVVETGAGVSTPASDPPVNGHGASDTDDTDDTKTEDNIDHADEEDREKDEDCTRKKEGESTEAHDDQKSDEGQSKSFLLQHQAHQTVYKDTSQAPDTSEHQSQETTPPDTSEHQAQETTTPDTSVHQSQETTAPDDGVI